MIISEVLDAIDNINSVSINNEINVCESLLSSYDKMSIIEENYNGNDIEGFKVFQEGFGDDVKKEMKNSGKNMNTFMKILSALPRFIIAIVKTIKNRLTKKTKNTAESISENVKKLDDNKKKALAQLFPEDKKGKIDAKKIILGVLGVGAVVASGFGVSKLVKKDKSEAETEEDKEESDTEAEEKDVPETPRQKKVTPVKRKVVPKGKSKTGSKDENEDGELIDLYSDDLDVKYVNMLNDRYSKIYNKITELNRKFDNSGPASKLQIFTLSYYNDKLHTHISLLYPSNVYYYLAKMQMIIKKETNDSEKAANDLIKKISNGKYETGHFISRSATPLKEAIDNLNTFIDTLFDNNKITQLFESIKQSFETNKDELNETAKNKFDTADKNFRVSLMNFSKVTQLIDEILSDLNKFIADLIGIDEQKLKHHKINQVDTAGFEIDETK